MTMKLMTTLFRARTLPGVLLAAALLPAQGAHAQSFRALYNFSSGDDIHPSAGVIDHDGAIYGVAGGFLFGNPGTIFRLDSVSGVKSTLHNFSLHPDGCDPSSLITLGGQLYGTAAECGNASSAGAVFRIDPATAEETVFHVFSDPANGIYPNELIGYEGKIYGTTDRGGGNDAGTVFSLDPATGNQAVLYSFANGADGQAPAGLAVVGGKLFGSTKSGGASNAGTVFEIDLANGQKRTLYSFTGGGDGQLPARGTMAYHDGMLFGTTQYGGPLGQGVLYRIDVATGTASVLHSFGSAGDGIQPRWDPVYYKGKLYGATSGGGTSGFGCIYQIDPDTGAETIVHSFNNVDGAFPTRLTPDGEGLLGTTVSGGAAGKGTVFKLLL